MGWSVTRDLFNTVASTGTISETYNVQGFHSLTMQIVGSPSTTTIQGSNDDGYTAAITNWSNLTAVIGVGMVEIDPGFRWLRCIRSETTNAIISGWQQTR